MSSLGVLIALAIFLAILGLVLKVGLAVRDIAQPAIRGYKALGTAQEDLPYKKKQYFLTYAEHGFFRTLQKVVGDQYYIFPQAHYSKLMYAEGQQNYKNPYFNKIDRKSADFVLFDKEKVSPVLVIEVDDSSHKRADRMERDGFIDRVLAKCEIPIARIPPYAGEDQIRKRIDEHIKGAPVTIDDKIPDESH